MKSCLFFTVILFSFSIRAQWTPTNGPYSGAVQGLTTKDGELFAAVAGGVISTSTSSIHWKNKSNGLPPNCDLRAICTLNNLLIVGGSNGNGIYISSDNGDHWMEANTGLGNFEVRCIHISGQDIFIGTTTGVFKSSDHCNSWTFASAGIPSTFINEFTQVNNFLFAASHSGIYRSDDNGDSWTAVTDGIIDTTIRAITKIGTNLFALNDDAVYKSVDYGTYWFPTNGNPLSTNPQLSIFAVDSTLFMGKIVSPNQGGGVLYKSVDQGFSWTQATSGMSQADYNISFPDEFHFTILNDTLYAGSTLGVHRSVNNGITWEGIGLGFGGGAVNAIKMDGNELYCGTKNGIYKSTDIGDSWYLNNNGIPSNTSILSILKHNNTLHIGTFGKGVYHSNNNGLFWSNDNNSLDGLFVSCLYSVGNTIYAGTSGSTNTNQTGIFQSTDNGLTWQVINNGLPNDILVFSISYNGVSLYIGTNHGVFLSNDLGSSWTDANNGLLINQIKSILALGQSIFAGQTYGGSTNPQYLGGVATSDNGGSNWSHNYYMDNRTVPCLFNLGTDVYAGCSMSAVGIYKTSDLGQTWSEFADGLESYNVTTITGNPNILLAGTRSSFYFNKNGVWKYNLNTTGIEPSLSAEEMIQLFPNPARNNLNVEALTPYNYSIYNAIGEKIDSGVLNKGFNSILITQLPIGSYFLHFNNEKSSFNKQFIKN
ncbi:MAG: hypothetical protein RIS20_1523 [Bacteroidota bacterium]|jgi:photosystem II stability/assembly factor-like uncharacterized protein